MAGLRRGRFVPASAPHGRAPRRFAQLGLARTLATVAAFAIMAFSAIPVAAGEPVASPGTEPARATCADRFPADGPAGVDLRLGCIAAEIVGLYTASSGQPPAPISTWVFLALAGIAAALAAGWLATRALARRASRRMAPVLSGSWWVCDRCRSVNGAEKQRCYACGAPPSGGPTMPTSEHPEIPQSFGGRGSR